MMSQIGTVFVKKHILATGTIMAAVLALAAMGGTLLTGSTYHSTNTTTAAVETYRVLGTSEEGVVRLDVGTGEISVCTVDLDGTLSCAVSGGQ